MLPEIEHALLFLRKPTPTSLSDGFQTAVEKFAAAIEAFGIGFRTKTRQGQQAHLTGLVHTLIGATMCLYYHRLTSLKASEAVARR